MYGSKSITLSVHLFNKKYFNLSVIHVFLFFFFPITKLSKLLVRHGRRMIRQL